MKTIWLSNRLPRLVISLSTCSVLLLSGVVYYIFTSRGYSLAGNQQVDRTNLTPGPTVTTNPTSGQILHQDCISTQTVCENSKLPELILVPGIEGSGHHLIHTLLELIEKSLKPTALSTKRGEEGNTEPHPNNTVRNKSIPSYKSAPYLPSAFLMAPAAVENPSHMGFAIIHHHLFRMRMKPILDALEIATKDGRKGLLYIQSYPTGDGGILSTSRPDLLMFKKYDCILYRLKCIVMKRHPLPAVMSSVRRFGARRFKGIDRRYYNDELKKAIPPEDYPLIMQARIIEDQLVYLDQQLRTLTCDQVHFMDINDVYSPSKKQKMLSSFALFLKLSNEETEIIHNMKVTAQATKVVLPPTCANCTERVLYDFFEERKVMWPLLAV
jgi:hypothetical protein